MDALDTLERQLAIARDFPDEAILSYTFPRSTSDWPRYGRIDPRKVEELVRKTGLERRREIALKVTPNPDYLVKMKELTQRQLISFLVHQADTAKFRRVKMGTSLFAFAFGSTAFAISNAGWGSGIQAPRILDNAYVALGLGIVAGVTTCFVHTKQVRIQPNVMQGLESAELLAFTTARRAKNRFFKIGLLLAALSFTILGAAVVSGVCEVLAMMATSILLVLSLEAALIGGFFQYKQQEIAKRIASDAERIVRPALYELTSEVTDALVGS